MILGKVHMCKHYSELKNYPVSITKECMKYQMNIQFADHCFQCPKLDSLLYHRGIFLQRNNILLTLVYTCRSAAGVEQRLRKTDRG